MIWFFCFFILQMSLKHALLKNKKTKHWKTNAHLTRKCAQIHTMVGVGSRDFCQGYSQEISLGWDFNLRKDLKTKCTGVAYCSYGKSNSVHDWNYFSTLEDFLKGLKLINLGKDVEWAWSNRFLSESAFLSCKIMTICTYKNTLAEIHVFWIKTWLL